MKTLKVMIIPTSKTLNEMRDSWSSSLSLLPKNFLEIMLYEQWKTLLETLHYKGSPW